MLVFGMWGVMMQYWTVVTQRFAKFIRFLRLQLVQIVNE